MFTVIIAIFATLTLMGLNSATVKVGAWYDALRKPDWNPPKWAFAPAWAIILSLAAWAGVSAWQHAQTHADRLTILALFAVNLLLNGAWSQIFFNLRRPDWALIEVSILWISILALIIGLAPISSLSAILLAPYLLWVTFASLLNFAIARLNRRDQAPRVLKPGS